MKSDADYLAEAGMKDTEAQSPAPAESSASTDASPPPATDSSNPNTTPATQAQPTPQEMFELMGNKYPVNTQFSLTHGGKILKVPYNNLVQTYRQAAHMEDKWKELKKAQAESQQFQTDFQKFKSFHDKFGSLQDWSEKNPQEWQRLYELWQKKDQLLTGAPNQPGGAEANPYLQQMQPLLQKVSQLEEKFGEVSKVRETWESQVREQKEMEDVNFVKDEVMQFSKKFPEIQMTEQDPDGVPLWAKIVHWGNANGYREFTSAAKIYLEERIADAYSTRARAEALKAQKQDFQNGIVKRSATPITGSGKAQPANLKKMSWGEIADLAKSGYGQLSGT